MKAYVMIHIVMWLLSTYVQLTELLLKLDHLTAEPPVKLPYFTLN